VDVEPATLALLAVVATAAGWVDAIAGGGGLIQLPSLLAAGIPLPHALGVNKASSICGTVAALSRYARHGHVHARRVVLPAVLAALGSALGAVGVLAAARRAEDVLEPAFAVCFLALAAWQAVKALGRRGEPVPGPSRPLVAAMLAAAIGAYDGIVGPGTGMFLFWAFTTFLSLAPLDATGSVKLVNALTNAAALAVFVARGSIVWLPALVMAAFNVLGGVLGAHTAIRRGVRFIRVVVAVVSAAVSVHLLLEAFT
jgi:uncharacterized membrane protein YfcA